MNPDTVQPQGADVPVDPALALDAFAELGLSVDVLDAVGDLGYTEPSPVQAEAIPHVLDGRDLLAAAQTGTGKTAAFLLPILSRLGHHQRHGGPTVLIVTPTRELAQQIEDVCRTICARTHHRSVTVVGGVSYNPQRAALKRGLDVLVATPGRLLDLMGTGDARLDSVEVLVLDEADRMLDMGFLPMVRKIVAACPADRQTLLFSATLDEGSMGTVKDLVRDPVRVEIAHSGTVAETIDQYLLPVSPEVKNGLLPKVLKKEGHRKVIVFCRTKHRADAVCRRLRKAGISCAPIHGNRSQNQRERALKAFRDGQVEVLVATDVLSRGIDIQDVDYVVNFDFPTDPEDYIHRIGRTGRAGETGWSLTFITPDEVEELLACEALMGDAVPTFPSAGSYDLGENPPKLDEDRVPAKVRGVPSSGKHRKSRTKAAAMRAVSGATKPKAKGRGKGGRAKGAGSGDGGKKAQATGAALTPKGTKGADGAQAPTEDGGRKRARRKGTSATSPKASRDQKKEGNGRRGQGSNRPKNGGAKGTQASRPKDRTPQGHRGQGQGNRRNAQANRSTNGWQSYQGPRKTRSPKAGGRRPGDKGGRR